MTWNRLAGAYLTAADKHPVLVTLSEKDSSNIISSVCISSVTALYNYNNSSYNYYTLAPNLYVNTDTYTAENIMNQAYTYRIDQDKSTYAVKDFVIEISLRRATDGLKATFVRDVLNRPYENVDNTITYTASDIRIGASSAGINFRPVWKFPQSEGWAAGDKVIFHIKTTATTYTGYTYEFYNKDYNSYILLDPTYDFNSSIAISNTNRSVLDGSYFEDANKVVRLGSTTVKNIAAEASGPIKVLYEFDTTNTDGLFVSLCRLHMPVGEYINDATVVLHNKTGDIETVSYTNTTKATVSTQGVYINANVVAESAGLSGDWYFSSIEYIINSIPGNTALGIEQRGMANASSFHGVAYNSAQSKITVEEVGSGASKNVTVKTTVTTTKTIPALISSFSVPESVVAGNNVVVNLGFSIYNYSIGTSNYAKSPVLWIALPEGVGLSSANVVGIGTPEVSFVKSAAYNGTSHNIYKIEMGEESAYGLYSKSTAQARTAMDTSTDNKRKLELLITTDAEMDNTAIYFRPLLFFAGDIDAHLESQQDSTSYKTADIFDLDNDGSTTDLYATIASGYKGNSTLTVISQKSAAESGITTSYTASLIWKEDAEYTSFRSDAVRIALKANGIIADYYNLVPNEDWSHTFTLLPAYDSNGAVTYSVEETEVPYRYKVTYDTSTTGTTVITNTLRFMDQVVIKRWDDDADREALRPESICAEIFDDSEGTGLIHELSGDGNEWSYTFEHIPYSDHYSVVETGARCVSEPTANRTKTINSNLLSEE